MGKLNKWFKENITATDWIAIIILLLAVAGIFYLPHWVTQKSWKYDLGETESNEIADTIGGILGPFISFISACLVYLALREQVKANRLIQRQFELEKVEKLEQSILQNNKLRLKEIYEKLSNFELLNQNGEACKGQEACNFAINIIFRTNEKSKHKTSALPFLDIINELFIILLDFNMKNISNNHILIDFQYELVRVQNFTQVREFEFLKEENLILNGNFHEVKPYYFFLKELENFQSNLMNKGLF